MDRNTERTRLRWKLNSERGMFGMDREARAESDEELKEVDKSPEDTTRVEESKDLSKSEGKKKRKKKGAKKREEEVSVKKKLSKEVKVSKGGAEKGDEKRYDQDDVQFSLSIPKSQLPVMESNYRLTRDQEDFAIRKVDELAKKGVIVPSRSHWNSPILIAPKDGEEKWRFCVDYRSVNLLTRKRDQFIPNIRNLVMRLRGGKWFAFVDLWAAYYRVMVAKDTMEFLAFTDPKGRKWTWARMPFGVADGPTIFNKWLYGILEKVVEECKEELRVRIVSYFDDIGLSGETKEEVKEAIRRLLLVLKSHGVFISEKGILDPVQMMKFCGYNISNNWISIPEKSVERILKSVHEATSVKSAQKALGMLQHYDIMLPRTSNIKKYLGGMITGKKFPELWEGVVEELEMIRNDTGISSKEIPEELLAWFDAADDGWNFVVTNEEKDELFRASGAFTDVERAKHISSKEALAAIKGIKKAGRSLKGLKAKLITDNQGLYKFLKGRKSSERPEFHRLTAIANDVWPGYTVDWVRTEENIADLGTRKFGGKDFASAISSSEYHVTHRV